MALGGGIAAVLCIPPAVSLAAGGATDFLLSVGHPVLASSTLTVAWLASSAVDEASGTRWASGAGVSGAGAGTEWLRVDLGAGQEVTRVRLHWATAYAKSYRIQLSDNGATWTDAYRTADGNGDVDDLRDLKGRGRYLRVLATQAAKPSGYSLWDVRAYGPGPASRVPESYKAPGAGVPPEAADLTAAPKKETAMELVSSAENSTLDWRSEFGYIEDLGDGRGYTGGIVGFCSGTGDMLSLVTDYTSRQPSNVLAPYLPALRAVDGTDSHKGLDPGFPAAWRAAAKDPVFRKTQEDFRDRIYFNPAVRLAQTDGLRALGQFAYYDAAVVHGVSGLRSIREQTLRARKAPGQGGDEFVYLSAFLDARAAEMRREAAHSDTTRVDTAQRVLLNDSNLDLIPPMTWQVYGDTYTINR
ncbi:chitosanase [Actinoplanes regularis]|uniref:Chitosanase n=2 Tax=Actinoplanes regularis TaxID=52697 RepID=A0A238V6W6_9ACTN|nr:hypothetical protein Are01nite_03080 [Actinoplanes regularis]GLW29724.1 hypothetical protein Areg01_26640 [Actinoplanes regularis]SNR29864.1 chitosanase [Actinoplanes regularis]